MAAAHSRRRFGFGVALAALVYIAFEIACAMTLWLLSTVHDVRYEPLPVEDLQPLQRFVLSMLIAGQHEHLTHDPELGWTIRPGGSTELYHANSQGLRGATPYAPRRRLDRIRIETFGDSFTHGDDVADPQTWQAQLEASDPRYEILNFGVPSYGLDQAFLRYQREGPAYTPDIVVIGFLSENLYRTVNRFRPFYRPPTGVPLSKPRFVLRGGKLALLANPLPSLDDYQRLLDDPVPSLEALGENDYYFERMQSRAAIDLLPSARLATVVKTRFLADQIIRNGIYAADSEAFQVTLHLFDAFVEQVQSDGATPLIALYPTSTDLRAHRAGKPRVYAPLLEALNERGYLVVDLLDAFETRGADERPQDLIGLHNTPLGNRIVAEHMREALDRIARPGKSPARAGD